jgi:hypothetical protein
MTKYMRMCPKHSVLLSRHPDFRERKNIKGLIRKNNHNLRTPHYWYAVFFADCRYYKLCSESPEGMKLLASNSTDYFLLDGSGLVTVVYDQGAAFAQHVL